MRWRSALGAVAVLACLTSCGGEPEQVSAGGVPESWYGAVRDAVAEQPDVGSTGLLESGGRCPLRDEVVLDGEEVSDVLDHGVVRLDGGAPAVLCHWYDGTPVEVEVAQAADAGGYAELVAGTRARKQVGNVQTERDVEVGGRTVHVVRKDYPTNPSAGHDLVASLLDEGARGRVRLEVSSAQDVAGYDETSVAEDLVATLGG